MKILLATKNPHKAAELAAIVQKLWSASGSGELKAVDLAQWEAEHGPISEAQEGETSFVENAVLKARHYAAASGLPALADDSGLSVAALNGEPGVLSARYGGPELDDAGRCEFLLSRLRGHRQRQAFFCSVLALAKTSGEYLYWEGRLDGLISEQRRGENGFGYDPIFYYPPSDRTTAEMTAEEKNSLSHRARAAAAFQADAGRVARFLADGG